MSSFSAQSVGCQHVVVGCSDFRLADKDKLPRWMRQHLGSADLLAVPGASKSLLEEISSPYILQSLKRLHDLHGFSTVHIVDHWDCGAYGGSKAFASRLEEEAMHVRSCGLAKAVVLDAYPDLFEVWTYLMGLDGQAAPLEVDIRRYADLVQDIRTGQPNSLLARGAD